MCAKIVLFSYKQFFLTAALFSNNSNDFIYKICSCLPPYRKSFERYPQYQLIVKNISFLNCKFH